MGYSHEIYCTVDNCHYWGQGNHCTAKEILVTADAVGASQPDSFDAPQAANAAATPCGSCMETCCKTFVEKGSGDYQMDNVLK